MTFLVDAQLPPLLARVLIQSGHVAKHVEELGFRNATDQQIWRHAVENNLVLVTKDSDFADRALKSGHAPAVIWLRLGNCSNSDLIERVLSRFPEMIQRLASGDLLIEVE